MRHYVAAVSEMCRLGSLQIVAMTTQCTPDVLSLMEVYAKGGQTVYHTLFSCAIEAAVARKPKLVSLPWSIRSRCIIYAMLCMLKYGVVVDWEEVLC